MAATFYADSAGTQGTGTGVSAANACTLKQFLEDDLVLHTARAAGDVCYCKNGTTITYDGSTGVFATPAVAGTTTSPVKVIGYNTTITDGGVVVLDDSDNGATNSCIDQLVNYWQFQNFQIIDPRTGIDFNTTVGHYCRNVEVQNAVLDGFFGGSITGDAITLENCYAHSCGGKGFILQGRAPRLVNCASIDNDGGFLCGNALKGAIYINCIAHGNTLDGFRVKGESLLVNCVSNRNGSDGYYVADSDQATVFVNCGATSNTHYGVEGVASTQINAVNCSFQPTNENNTSGKISGNVTIINEVGEVTGDPDFTDSNPVTKTDVDLSLSSSSAWKGTGAGIGGAGFSGTSTSVDIGMAQRTEPAGGASSVLGGGNLEGGFL